MTIQELLKTIIVADLPPVLSDSKIQSIVSDSRQVIPGSLFVALPGVAAHGSAFIDEAIRKGAICIVTSREFSRNKKIQDEKIPIIGVEDPLEFLKKALLHFYGNPSGTIKVLGVTGTNGKTTITYLLESILSQRNERCAVLGTINHRVGEKILVSKNTTPGLVDNHVYLSQMLNEKVGYCAMEVSSHALHQGRVDLIDFSTAIFTNLTGDHLDYHKDMENYFQAKSILFKRLSPQASAVINIDDPYGKRLFDLTQASTQASILTYGLIDAAHVRAVNIQMQLTESHFTVIFPGGKLDIKTKLIGQHNVYNILACVAVCLSQGIDTEQIQKGVEKLHAVAGRLERIEEAIDFHVYIDYAHTEDALKNVLASLKKVNQSKIILVFGCGGNRDKTKRPKMGKVASLLADWSIITSDNPRDEDPDVIIQEITDGFMKKNYEVIVDRREAIHKALKSAKKNEVVLIAGKGHENYQIFKDQTIHFDDCEIVREYFLNFKKTEMLQENPI